jgi:atypical dual specificity phosphatase
LFSSIFAHPWGVDCDEVFPNIFIGDEASARNLRFLKNKGITHVLNCAEGIWTDYSFVDLTAEYYEGSGITYQGLQVWDSTKAKMIPYYGCANEFIALALNGGSSGNGVTKGKCLVHCQMGVSRSCVAAVVYMMLSEGWCVADIMTEFRKRRDVRDGIHQYATRKFLLLYLST